MTDLGLKDNKKNSGAIIKINPACFIVLNDISILR